MGSIRTGSFISLLRVVLLAACCCSSSLAQTNKSFQDAEEACGDTFHQERWGERFGHIVDCGADIISMRPIAPAVKSIVPGGGIGFGLISKFDIFKRKLPDFNTTWISDARVSTGLFWVADSAVEFKRKPTDGSNYGWNLKSYVSRLELPHMDFYGLGGQTTPADLVSFNERETAGGASLEYPIKFGTMNPYTQAMQFHSALVLGGILEGRSPRIGSVAGSSRRSIEQLFSETDTPGVATGPDNFVHAGGTLAYRYPLLDPKGIYQIGADMFHDFEHQGRYSFRRFSIKAQQNVFHFASLGALQLTARLSTSIATQNRRVPFYYQETIGGSNISGEDTVRGYVDYRFRAPNLLLLQSDYEYPIPHTPLSALLFYDAGDAQLRRRDLGQLRQTAARFWRGCILRSAAGRARIHFSISTPLRCSDDSR
jgi:hypothetical protein